MASSRPPLVDVRDLTSVLGGQLVLDKVSFTVQRGEIFGVMGMSGAGKSTLLRNIMGLVRPQGGQILIDGEEVVGRSEAELNVIRARMGMCFQYAALFDSLSVFENVAFGLRRRKVDQAVIEERVSHYLDVVGLEGTGDLMPADLSGGMRKRVGVARALVTEPELVLYDEPTSGLDPVLAATIDALIVKLRDQFGVTSIVVTHDVPHLFGYADRALMLYEGRARDCGSPQHLRESPDAVLRQFIEGSVTGPIQV